MENKYVSSGRLAASVTSDETQRGLDQRRTWLSGKAVARRLGHPPLEQREQAGTLASWGEEHYPEGSPKHSREVGHGLGDSSRSTAGGSPGGEDSNLKHLAPAAQPKRPAH